MCAGCGNRFAKAALVRFTVRETPEGRSLILSDAPGGSGRGGYVCASLECFDKAFARKMLVRRLNATVEAGDLREEFARLIEMR
ncbi:MAG: YlxR family protein [Thermoleophilia bacterium]